jgi:RHS repeat-associated protein
MKYRIEKYTKHYYTGNHLSSTQLVTDGTGVAVQQVEYAPFGEVVNEYNIDWNSGQVPDFKFNGKELDEENGMYYFEARYQSPPVFISRDVMFEKYPMFSPYAYCYNNPLLFIDPTGKEGDISLVADRDKRKNTNHVAELTSSLSTITGLNVTTKQVDGKTLLDYEKDTDGNPIINTDANGNLLGSATARTQFTKLVNDLESISIDANPRLESSGSNSEINLNFSRIKGLMDGVQNNLNKETMGYGMVLLHEFLHTCLGGKGTHGVEATSFGKTGDIVDLMNTIRSELGESYGQRKSYKPILYQGMTCFPFSDNALDILKKSDRNQLRIIGYYISVYNK